MGCKGALSIPFWGWAGLRKLDWGCGTIVLCVSECVCACVYVNIAISTATHVASYSYYAVPTSWPFERRSKDSSMMHLKWMGEREVNMCRVHGWFGLV